HQVLRTGSADCKGKALLLHAMLSAIGIASTPVLVNLDDRFQDFAAPASTLAFNHVVLAIDAPEGAPLGGRLTQGPGANWVLFDPTDALATYGLPSHRVADRYGLWLTPSDGALFRIHQQAPLRAETVEVHARLEPDGNVTFDASLTGPGETLYELARDASAAGINARLTQTTTERLRRQLPGLRVLRGAYEPPDHAAPKGVSVRLEGAVPNALAALTGARFSLEAPVVLMRELAAWPTNGYAYQPPSRRVAVPTGWQVGPCCEGQHHRLELRLHLDLPRGWEVTHVPRFGAVDTAWLRAEWSATTAPGTLQWQAVVEWRRGRFPHQPAEARAALLNEVVAALRQPVLLDVVNDTELSR
ncbi:MAG: hypothetical protein AAFX85_18880, partial [Pseudomonadota bacterium]